MAIEPGGPGGTCPLALDELDAEEPAAPEEEELVAVRFSGLPLYSEQSSIT
jgi:hypothetical protein